MELNNINGKFDLLYGNLNMFKSIIEFSVEFLVEYLVEF